MVLLGKEYKKGSILPEDLPAKVPPGRLRSLINTGLFTEVEDDYQVPETQPTEEVCPICGDSFKRLAQHISMKHETTEALEEALLDDSV